MLGWISAIILGLVLGSPSPPQWSDVYEDVSPSLLRLSYRATPYQKWKSYCTVVVVSETRMVGERHCFTSSGEYWAGGAVTHLYVQDELVALPTPMAGLPALQMVQSPPKHGEGVAAIGYGWGGTQPVISVGRVSGGVDPGLTDQFSFLKTPHFWVNITLWGGQSGGALVNKAGELVSLSRMTIWRRNPGERMAAYEPPARLRAFIDTTADLELPPIGAFHDTLGH